jgi:hypothetical protein
MRTRNFKLPSVADHLRAMQAGDGLHVYHSKQYGLGWGSALASAWRWAKPILTGAAKSGAQSAVAAGLKASKGGGDWKSIAKTAANAGFQGAKTSAIRGAQNRIAAGDRPF